MSKIIGIDLGTSTSEAAYLKDGKPVIIPNNLGKRITPSVVYIDNQGVIKVGEAAQSYTILEPENTAIEVKRLMGSGQTVNLAGSNFTPQQVSSYILKYLKKCAEDFLGEAIQEAVITVPAYFTNEQRVATKEAGELAGFKVERIINEPTAAALTYGLEHLEDQKHVLVYDLGGGTLDVTVLEMFEGVLDVKSSSGNNKLGGKDFDESLINYLLKAFEDETKINISNDRKAMARLKEAAAKAKIELSKDDIAVLSLPFIATLGNKPLGMHYEITRHKFEELIGDMVKSTLNSIDIALKDAELTENDIDTILLIGGSTRIPLVQKIIKDKFGKEPMHEVNPDEAVAMGAAIQAGIKSGELAGEKDILITDVCPYTLGTEVLSYFDGIPLSGVFDPLIKRNTTIPVSVKEKYLTVVDNQKAFNIKVFQGDDIRTKNNNFLGSFMLEDLPPALAGDEKFEVEFSYDINGILKVDAILLSTGEKGSITVDTTALTPIEEIDVEEGWKKSRFARKVKALIKNTEKKLNNPYITEISKKIMEEMLYDLKLALTKNDKTMVKKYENDLTELLYSIEE